MAAWPVVILCFAASLPRGEEAGGKAGPGGADGGRADVLNTYSFWRCHAVIRPPLFARASGTAPEGGVDGVAKERKPGAGEPADGTGAGSDGATGGPKAAAGGEEGVAHRMAAGGLDRAGLR
ncbi:MAG: hypothetical protein N3A38_05060 [Planctomycetota bacterium]|nr:hypothetical protein [Planctomycetota bacterium]